MKIEQTLSNPILTGFYPDPSICRVNDDFYLVTSSFELFPGVPIFHSTDLANWEQIGHVLDRKSQLHLEAGSFHTGIFAPTIRYNNGVFYLITTNLCDKGNFIVTATNPAGPWSEPHWLENAVGIDPSLFFDDDGKAYYSGTRMLLNEDGDWIGSEIWLSEINLVNMCLVGEKIGLWKGALCNAASPEAPHLYKKDGYYYLMIAEGGTEHFHAVTIARSEQIFGEYEGFQGNPIMTHRHLGKMYPISNVGHADLVELKNGDWYMVMLGSRLIEGYHKNLGRETFIAPVVWEDGWPVVSPGSGNIDWSYPAPQLPELTPKPLTTRDDFNGNRLDFQWVSMGTPYQDFYTLANSKLVLKLVPRSMCSELKQVGFELSKTPDMDDNCLGFIGRRQTSESFSILAKMDFQANSENETAGIVMMQAFNHQFRLERSMEAGKQLIRLMQSTTSYQGKQWMPGFQSTTSEIVLAKEVVDSFDICLKIESRGQTIDFYYGSSEDSLQLLFRNADGRLLNPEIVGGMVGTMLGMFASSNGSASNNSASFEWFEYHQL